MPPSASPPLHTPRGLDPWMAVGGMPFSVWDRWFLALVVADHDAWQPIRDALRAKRDAPGGLGQRDAEAKLSHLADLRRRWGLLDEASRERLSADCRDRHLLKRARARVVDETPRWSHMSPPMRDTPRHVLRERARRGYWARFPVSPVRYEPVFAAIGRERDFFSERASFGLARRLDAALARELSRAAAPAHRTAVLRSFLTGFLGVMDRADDSCGVLGDLAWSEFPKYFKAPWQEAGLEPELYYRDFLEFATWEDYGLLFEKLEPFFKAVDRAHVDLVDALLCEIHEELRAAELDYQAEEALTLRAEFNATKRRFDRFAALAATMGSRHWRRIVRMAETAIGAGRRDLAASVFAAADQPGSQQEHLHAEARRLLGHRAVRVTPDRRLTLVRKET